MVLLFWVFSNITLLFQYVPFKLCFAQLRQVNYSMSG